MFCALGLFSAVPRASGPVFMFYAPEHIFGGTYGVGSRFHVLHSRTRFQRFRGCQVLFSCLRPRISYRRNREHRVPFSYFALLDTFSALRRALGPVLMISAPVLFFGGFEGLGFRFNVLRPCTRFQRYRGRRVTFSSYAMSDSFLAEWRA
jgi:hypothetical protein